MLTNGLYSQILRTTNNNFNNVENILKRLKKALDITTDIELAERLGYNSTGTISMWKNRGEVKWDRIFNKIENINPTYLKYGEGKPFLLSQDPLSEAFEFVNQATEAKVAYTASERFGDDPEKLLRLSQMLIEIYLKQIEKK